jgi:Flp pilus assembly protein CpaB
MSRKVRLIVAIVALVIAVGGGFYAYRFYDSQVTTAQVVTLTKPVPPYTLITEEMLEVRQVPRGVLDEPIYRTPGEVVGKVAAMPLAPGQLIYQHQAVSPASFRYTDDPTLEIVSFPVDPARAVGGQLRIGHQINVYRVRVLKNNPVLGAMEGAVTQDKPDITPVLAVKGAEAEVLAEAVPVVDLRSGGGEPSADYYNQQEPDNSRQQRRPLQILTVAVPPDVAEKLVELAVEEEVDFALWVTLAPLQEEVQEALP